MASFFYAIVTLFIIFLNPYSEPPASQSIFETVLCWLGLPVFLAVGAYISARRIKCDEGKTLERFLQFKRRWLILNLIVLAANFHIFGLFYFMRTVCPPLLLEIVVVGVFIGQTAFVLWAISKTEIRIRSLPFSSSYYILFHIRQYLVAALPFLVFAAFFHLLTSIQGLEEALEIFPSLAFLPVALLIFVMFTLFPVGLRFLFPNERLKREPIRTVLLHLARSVKVEARDVLVWKTGLWRVANAAVSGLLGRLRYVFLTDSVLDFPEDEVCAVFAHELGHAKMHHTTLYMVLAISFVGFTLFLERILLALSPGNQILVFVCFAILFWFFLFGYISRRFEQGADIFAARLVGAEALARALLRIFAFTGTEKRTILEWRHFPIERRVETLKRMSEHLPLMDKLLKTTRNAMIVLILLVICGLGGYLYCAFEDASLPQDTIFFLRARYAQSKGDYERALGFAKRALDKKPDSERYLELLKEIKRMIGER
jgi:Zn-dependent protease with chaperone function